MADDIEKYVEAWHESTPQGLPLHEFLGLTWAEFSSWMRAPQTLQETLRSITAAVNHQGR